MATHLSKLLRLAPTSFRKTTSRLPVVAAAGQGTGIRKLNAGVAKTVAPTFTISGEGKKLEALWSRETPPSTYHAVWLRHNCHCPQCLSGNNQKSVLTTSVDPNVAIADFKIGKLESRVVRDSVKVSRNRNGLRKPCTCTIVILKGTFDENRWTSDSSC